MSEWKEDAIRHKYDPLPEDGPRHKKKAKREHVRSDHRHEYEEVCIDAHLYAIGHAGRFTYYDVVKRCRLCGRVGGLVRTCIRKPPDGMRLFKVDDVHNLWHMKVLPDELEVVRKGSDS